MQMLQAINRQTSRISISPPSPLRISSLSLLNHPDLTWESPHTQCRASAHYQASQF